MLETIEFGLQIETPVILISQSGENRNEESYESLRLERDKPILIYRAIILKRIAPLTS